MKRSSGALQVKDGRAARRGQLHKKGLRMAVTRGHGNAAWNREETILALELYHQMDGQLRKSDERVEELSRYLRSLPYHPANEQNQTFRNSDGVYFKLQNIRSVLTGEGLGNTSRMDRIIADRLGNDPVETARLARIIRSSVELITEDDLEMPEEFEDDFYEGRSAYVLHRKIERDSKLRKKVLKQRSPENLVCDICDFSRPLLPVEVQESFFEVHHVVPLSILTEVKSYKMADLAFLCANCHRGIHKLMSIKKEVVTLSDARSGLLLDK